MGIERDIADSPYRLAKLLVGLSMASEEGAEGLWQRARDREVLILCLVRHGQTSWNASRRFLGRTDIGLDEVGRAQALSFARALPEPFAQVYASPLCRAQQTARCLGVEVIEAPELVELDQGELEGLDGPQAFARYATFFQRWAADPERAMVPGGESLGQLRDRALRGVRRIAAQHRPGQVLGLFTHQMVIAALTCVALDEPLTAWRSHRVENTQLTALELKHGRLHVLAHGLSLVPVAEHA